MSNAPSKPVSFSRPKVGYFSNRPRIYVLARVAGGMDHGIGIYLPDMECQLGWILEFVFMSLVLDSWRIRS